MKTQIKLLLIFGLIAAASGFGQTTALHDVNVNLGAFAVIALNSTADVNLTIDGTGVTPGQAPGNDTDATKYLRYTVLSLSGTDQEITATISGDPVPTGARLDVAATVGSSGAGDEGTTGGTVNLSTGGDVINSIASCYTGVGATSGSNMTYTLSVDNWSTIKALAAASTITVTYTIKNDD